MFNNQLISFLRFSRQYQITVPWLIASHPLSAIRSWPPVASRYRQDAISELRKTRDVHTEHRIRDGTPRIDFSHNALAMLSDTAGTPIIIKGRKALYFLCVVPFRASVGFDASVIAWHADENHFQLYNVLQFVGYGG